MLNRFPATEDDSKSRFFGTSAYRLLADADNELEKLKYLSFSRIELLV